MSNHEVEWLNKEGDYVPFDTLTNEELVNALSVINKRQFKAYNTIELNCNLETKVLAEIKKRKIAVIEVGNSFFEAKWPRVKEILKRINRIIKLDQTKNGKSEILLPKTDS